MSWRSDGVSVGVVEILYRFTTVSIIGLLDRAAALNRRPWVNYLVILNLTLYLPLLNPHSNYVAIIVYCHVAPMHIY